MVRARSSAAMTADGARSGGIRTSKCVKDVRARMHPEARRIEMSFVVRQKLCPEYIEAKG